MVRANDFDVIKASKRFLECTYAKSSTQDQSIDEILFEASVVRDEPPSVAWVGPFAKMTAACCERRDGWGDVTSDLIRHAENVPEFLVQMKCERECLSVYAQLFTLVMNDHPPRSRFDKTILSDENMSSVSESDDVIVAAITVEEGIERYRDFDYTIKQLYLDWLAGKCSPMWSAQYLLSLVYSFRWSFNSALHKRSDFQSSVMDEAHRRTHSRNGWKV